MNPVQAIKKTLKGGKIRFITPKELHELKSDPWFIYIGSSWLPGVWDPDNFAEGEVGIKADTFERIILRK